MALRPVGRATAGRISPCHTCGISIIGEKWQARSLKIDVRVDDQAVLDALNRLVLASADLEPAFADFSEHPLLSHFGR
jgi:DNA-directed RNA polymerase subunit N (RpoN/RPB10)